MISDQNLPDGRTAGSQESGSSSPLVESSAATRASSTSAVPAKGFIISPGMIANSSRRKASEESSGGESVAHLIKRREFVVHCGLRRDYPSGIPHGS